ncbi:alkaline phosphatase family protein [Sphingomonas abietis]|uniref:Ectonucleotide pyrophosphatase/phosphodiesterase n=1 Tax=Sphingomonas abietis TaxID=3012344 RepID=A0ABY7NLW9_9SPHN|nr:ectonucleotide pyrophosphatase/phosphodiesterase [Sphingomonas abietis]WBO22232.1 ectonucleotide pyrophosphatase/phosphodiesterase [Sphingomonas abietis]
MLRLFKALCPLAVALLAGCAAVPHQGQAKVAATTQAPRPARPVILVSIDGFRPDYLDRGVTPTLNALAAGGARAAFMRPSFPSITFPNHYTLVTGLRPDHHGIVANTMEDPAMPEPEFQMSNHAAVTDHRWWDEGEPIWVTAERHGIRSGTMFWPGSEAAIHGVRPRLWKRFDFNLPNAERVDTVLHWMDKPASRRPGFVTLYFEKVDHEGHEHGPDSPEVTQAIADVDRAIGRLVDGLRARHVDADIVIVSDHGMAAKSVDRGIRLDSITAPANFHLVTHGPVAEMDATPGKEQELADALLKPQDHMQCWRKDQIPARFAYGHNPRVPAFVCLAQVGWYISADGADLKDGGDHGYDNAAPEMHATFIATGPSIRPGTVLPPFDNVDVYPFVMRLLGLSPLPSDGDIAPLTPALRE